MCCRRIITTCSSRTAASSALLTVSGAIFWLLQEATAQREQQLLHHTFFHFNIQHSLTHSEKNAAKGKLTKKRDSLETYIPLLSLNRMTSEWKGTLSWLYVLRSLSRWPSMWSGWVSNARWARSCHASTFHRKPRPPVTFTWARVSRNAQTCLSLKLLQQDGHFRRY